MKKLTDADIANMVGAEFAPNSDATRRTVRAELKLSKRIPQIAPQIPEHAILDLHRHTVDQAWDEIMNLATSGVRRATIITGASGVLKPLFIQWATESILTPYIISVTPINNGSFDVVFRKESVRNTKE